MLNRVKLSPINQKFFQKRQIAIQNFSSKNLKTPDNELKCDIFVNSRKKVINFTSNNKASKSPAIMSGTGTRKDPYIEETRDIALGDEKQLVKISSCDDKIQVYSNSFLIDVDKSSSIPLQGIGSPIEEAYENHTLKFLLRDIQFNGEVSDTEKEKLKAQFHEKNPTGEEIRSNYETDEEYVQASIRKAYDNLDQQKDYIKELAPSTQDCVLYKGIEHYFHKLNFQHKNEFYNMLENLKEGDKTILDWSAMCTTGNFYLANRYGTYSMLRIKTPKGSRLYHRKKPDMDEIRFPSKSEFIYKGKNNYNGITIWDFEYIVPEY